MPFPKLEDLDTKGQVSYQRRETKWAVSMVYSTWMTLER